MKSKLNSTELFMYSSLWFTAIILSFYKLFQVQSEILKVHHEDEWVDLKPGWPILSRYRDLSEFEWNTWKHFFETSWYHLILQFAVSEMIRVYNKCYVKYCYLSSGVLYVTVWIGIKGLILISFQPVAYLTVIFCGGGKISIWLLSIAFLGVNCSYPELYWHVSEIKDLLIEEVGLIHSCITWGELRCISFSLNYIDKKNNKTEEKVTHVTMFENVINMMSYVCYLPPMFTGPIMLYEDFEKSLQVQRNDLTERLTRFTRDMVLFLIYTFVLDLGFHYIYFSAMQNDIEIISKMDATAIYGGALWIALEFYMKYVISYGIASAFARLDNLDAPPTPRCVFRIHLYSQMWRYFDVGLYKFLVKYIYKPSQRQIQKSLNMPSFAQKMASSLVTFLFIFLWHGINRAIFVWFVLNFLGVAIESLVYSLSRTETYKWFKKEILKTDRMELRFRALICTPLLIMSVIANFFLLGSFDFGFLIFKRFIQPSWSSMMVLLAVFCCCHTSIALESVSARTDVKNQSTLS